MAKLARVGVCTGYACQVGTVVLHWFQALPAADLDESLSGEDSVTVRCARSDAAVPHLAQRRILRLVFEDGTWSEWRIQKLDDEHDTSGTAITIVATSPILDLLDAGPISETLSSGIVNFDIGVIQKTVSEVITDYILTDLPAEYNNFALGQIDPTALFDVSWDKSTRLALLRQLALAARDVTTLQPAEIRVRRNGTVNYLIDVLAEIGSAEPVADLRTQKNIQRHRRERDAGDLVTVVVPLGAEGTTIGRAAWKLDNPTGLVYEITDPEGGQSPILEDDQLNDMYVVPDGTGALIRITDSAAGSPATVTLASSTGITDGKVYELRADVTGRLNTELVSPSRVVPPPTGFGRKVRMLDRPDLYGYRNLVPNPWYRNWASAGSAPDDWEYNVGAGAFSQNTDPLYTQYGGKSVKFTTGGSTTYTLGILRTALFYPRPVPGAEFFSYRVRLFPKIWSGVASMSIYFLTASGIIPLGQHQWISMNHPTTGGDGLPTGNWFDVGPGAIDLTTAAAGVRLIIQLEVGNTTVAGAGNGELYIDAVMVVQDFAVPLNFIEFSGGNALHHAGNRALANNRDGVDAYELSVIDREREDATAYPFERLVIGGTIRDTVTEQSIDSQLLRVLRKRTNLNVPKDTKLEVATRQKLLSDLLAGAAGGSSVQVVGGGAGASTPPPPGGGGTTPVPGGNPSTPTGGTAAPTLGLLKTIIADPPGVATILENFPATKTDLGAECHFLVDFTNVPRVFLSGVVLDDDGCAGEVRCEYLRPSDATWRYLDGTAGPELAMDTIGDVQSIASVNLEASARGWRWCRPVAIGGDDVASPVIGHVALHGGSLPTPIAPTPPSAVPGDGYDWNPTEGSGSTITDKRGSGIDATLVGGTWVAEGVRYDHLGTFNYQFASVTSDALTMVHSSVMLYAKLPPALNAATGYFCGRRPGVGSEQDDRHFYIDGSGVIHATVTQAAGSTNKTVDSTTTFGVDDEMCLCWTHDGTTLRLYINGVEEDSILCGDTTATTPTTFFIAAGQPALSAQEPPSNGGLFGSTGTVLGRVRVANRGWTPAEVAALYAEFRTQYPGLP